jgi:hypothetical protein
MANIIINVAKSHNIKVIDATHLDIENLFRLSTKIIYRDDTMIIFKNFQISKRRKQIFNKITDTTADNNITIFYKEDWITLPLDNINTITINRWIFETYNNNGNIHVSTCDICITNKYIMGKCAFCLKSICKDCIGNNFLKNNTKKCPFCKTYDFDISNA